MRGKVAKRIRKEVYGDTAMRQTKYYLNEDTGAIQANPIRKRYQQMKKEYVQGKV